MRIKSYYAGTVEAAMELAAKELGPEAWLLNTRPAPPEAARPGEYEVVFGWAENETQSEARDNASLVGSAEPWEKLSREIAELRRELEETAAQAAQNVFRLRNHPSLALWCGGNESNAYAPGNAAPIGVFERTVLELDGTRPWRRTSPDVGGLHQYPDMDPTWYGKMYRFVPFMAETGMHNIPEARSMREVVAAREFEKPLADMYSQEFAGRHPEFRHHFAEFLPSRVPRMLSRASHIADMSAPTIEALSEASQLGAAEFCQILSEQVASTAAVGYGNYPGLARAGSGSPTPRFHVLKRGLAGWQHRADGKDAGTRRQASWIHLFVDATALCAGVTSYEKDPARPFVVPGKSGP